MTLISDMKKKVPIEAIKLITGSLKPRSSIITSIESMISDRGLDVSSLDSQ